MWNISFHKGHEDYDKTNHFVVDTNILQILVVWQYMKQYALTIACLTWWWNLHENPWIIERCPKHIIENLTKYIVI